MQLVVMENVTLDGGSADRGDRRRFPVPMLSGAPIALLGPSDSLKAIHPYVAGTRSYCEHGLPSCRTSPEGRPGRDSRRLPNLISLSDGRVIRRKFTFGSRSATETGAGMRHTVTGAHLARIGRLAATFH
jgi:hypothetical protein